MNASVKFILAKLLPGYDDGVSPREGLQLLSDWHEQHDAPPCGKLDERTIKLLFRLGEDCPSLLPANMDSTISSHTSSPETIDTNYEQMTFRVSLQAAFMEAKNRKIDKNDFEDTASQIFLTTSNEYKYALQYLFDQESDSESVTTNSVLFGDFVEGFRETLSYFLFPRKTAPVNAQVNNDNDTYDSNIDQMRQAAKNAFIAHCQTHQFSNELQCDLYFKIFVQNF